MKINMAAMPPQMYWIKSILTGEIQRRQNSVGKPGYCRTYRGDNLAGGILL